jgi:tryptophan synthase beta chain
VSAEYKPAGGRPAPPSTTKDDEPWERLKRKTQAELRGEDPLVADLGDTANLLRRDRTNAVMIEGPGPSTEILQLVTDSLAEAPERGDLWMMRFEVQRTLGLKDDFRRAVVQAWKNPRVSRQLSWEQVRVLWDELAPGEALPEGIKLPEPSSAASPLANHPGTSVTPAGTPHNRRFADVANKIASRELAVLAKAYAALHARPGFMEEYARKVGPVLKRPTPLQFAEGLSRLGGGHGHARIFLKREDQRGVTPEEENATAQVYIAAMLGRPAVITGNDVDAHSLALAAVAPRLKLKCTVVVRRADLRDKAGLIERLRNLGAQVEPMADSGTIGSDPREGALRLWQRSMGQAHLALSLGTGPNPFPAMINNFQAVLGRETELQLRAAGGEARRPRTFVAAVESEADSIGFILPQLARDEVELMYAEPEPGGVASWRPSARLRAYNGAIREHAWLRGSGRIEHVAIGDSQAETAGDTIAHVEQVRVGLEDARAVALVLLLMQRSAEPHDFVVLVA